MSSVDKSLCHSRLQRNSWQFV